jgi:uncharacterized membrane protein
VPEAPSPRPSQLFRGLGLAALVLLSPLVANQAFAHFDVRSVASVLLLLGLAGLVSILRRRPQIAGIDVGFGPGPQLAFIALAAAAAVTNDRVWLLCLPALVYALLCWLFASSLRGGSSLIAKLARVVDPKAPAFIEPFCRKSTLVWAGLFAVNAVVVAALALGGPLRAWKLYSGIGAYLLLGAWALVEFLIRKLWFRNYTRAWYDRLLARAFPAENTPEGRRSLAYIREMRRKLGMPEP